MRVLARSGPPQPPDRLRRVGALETTNVSSTAGRGLAHRPSSEDHADELRHAGTTVLNDKGVSLRAVRQHARSPHRDAPASLLGIACSRSVHDFSVLLEELRAEDAGFASCTESFDTSDPMGEAMVQITMVFAQLERARSSQRALARHAHRARRGDPYLGRAPFGYVRARDEHGRPVGPLELDEETASLVRQAAELFVTTGSMGVVQRFLGEHGYERWTQSLRKGLASPQLAGIRIVDGVQIPGSWPAILDVATHEAIVAELNKSERGRGRPAGERWLLSGFMVCGRCGQSMRAGGHRQVKAKGGGMKLQRHYRCARPGNRSNGCGATMAAEPLEDWVEAQVLAKVTPQLWRKLRSARTRRAPHDAVAAEADLVALARRFGAGELLEVEWNAARAVLLERIAAAEAGSDSRPADVPDVKDLHAAWRRGDLSVQDKRRVLAVVVERITINRGVRGRTIIGNRPEDRVATTWRPVACGTV
jgi:Resolvase, N terminal domain/Recombinase zinc beta ribbon domain